VGSVAASRATGLDTADGLATPTAPTASGAVYVFGQAGATWQQEFKASTGQQNGFFGSCVSLSADGGQLAVGASLAFEDSAASGINGNEDDDRAADSGAVYVC